MKRLSSSLSPNNIPSLLETVYVVSKIGTLEIQGNKKGVSKISFTKKKITREKNSNFLLKAKNELKTYFDKRSKKFSFKIIYYGTPLEIAVWKTLEKVPYGKTISYKELAIRAGYPTAVRAVASAVGRNKFLIRIPCHRIIASDGTLGGFSAGVSKKKQLLRHELKSS